MVANATHEAETCRNELTCMPTCIQPRFSTSTSYLQDRYHFPKAAAQARSRVHLNVPARIPSCHSPDTSSSSPSMLVRNGLGLRRIYSYVGGQQYHMTPSRHFHWTICLRCCSIGRSCTPALPVSHMSDICSLAVTHDSNHATEAYLTATLACTATVSISCMLPVRCLFTYALWIDQTKPLEVE